MSNKPIVSVCVVAYNHEKFIEYCINSIWNQEYKNIEILVLDDGSTDESVEILNTLKQKSPFPMTVISQKNSGCIGGNFNKLFQIAKGDYISIIAADDALFPNAISKKVEMMNNDESVQFVINSQIQAINENNESIDYYTMPLDNIDTPSAQDILNLDFNDIHSYYLQGSLFRKSIIDDVEGFDEEMVADDIVLRTKLSRYLLKNPQYNFINLHEPACYYRRHTSNISDNMPRQIRAVALYYDKYWKGYKISKCFDVWCKDCCNNKPMDMLKLATEIDILRPYKIRAIISFIKRFGKNIISINNSENKKHKIISILGIKIKIKRN